MGGGVVDNTIKPSTFSLLLEKNERRLLQVYRREGSLHVVMNFSDGRELEVSEGPSFPAIIVLTPFTDIICHSLHGYYLFVILKMYTVLIKDHGVTMQYG